MLARPGYWGPDYAWGPDYVGYWAPDDTGYWDEPYYVGWAPDAYAVDYPYWRPRLWRHYRRPIEAVNDVAARPALTLAVAYDAPADCGGAHYVWDDYAGDYVFRPYAFPC